MVSKISLLATPDVHVKKMGKKKMIINKLRRFTVQLLLYGSLVFAFSAVNAKDFVYTNNNVLGTNSVTAFEVTATGLTNIGTFTTNGLGTGGGFFSPNRIALSVVGNFLYVVNDGTSDIDVFSINPVTGALTLITATAAVPTGGTAGNGISLGVTPDSKFLLAGNSASGDVSVFDIFTSPGTPMPVAGSPFAVPSVLGDLVGLRVTPDGQFVAVGEILTPNSLSGNTVIHVFSISPAGALAPISTSPFLDSGLAGAGGGASEFDITCRSDRLYAGEATSGSTLVSVYDIADGTGPEPAGALIPNSVASPGGIGTNSNNVLLSRDEKHLFVSNNFSSHISVFDIAPSGGLLPVAGSPFALSGSPSPGDLATNLTGTQLYVGNVGGTVSVFDIATNGVLTEKAASPITTGVVPSGPLSLTVFPSSICGSGTVVVTPVGDDITVFVSAPGSGVPLTAIGEVAVTADESSVLCCTVQDPNPFLTGDDDDSDGDSDSDSDSDRRSFDIGFASNTEPSCIDLPRLDRGELKIPAHFGVHTDPAIADEDLTAADHRYGLCVVQTAVEWLGAVVVDVAASEVVGYDVECKPTPDRGIDNQPLVLARTTDLPEFAQKMRSITSECDPRGSAKWTEWWFVVNAEHLTAIKSSEDYVGGMSEQLRDMIEAMRDDGAVDSAFLETIEAQVEDAEDLFEDSSSDAMDILDNATIDALTEAPGAFPYFGSALFTNPKGELVSHLMALRYAVCSERAHAGDLINCRITSGVEGRLPGASP